jgi:NADH:ubiquinone oxidoreductase subunit 6 (subunit J)
MKTKITLASLSFLMLAAHFSRIDNTYLMLLSLIIPFLFFFKKRSTLILIQVFCYLGAIAWLYAMYGYIQQRIALGIPWGKLAVIISVIAIFTVVSGFLLNTDVMKKKYTKE